MANNPISLLPAWAGSTINMADLLAIVNAGVTKKITITEFIGYLNFLNDLSDGRVPYWNNTTNKFVDSILKQDTGILYINDNAGAGAPELRSIDATTSFLHSILKFHAANGISSTHQPATGQLKARIVQQGGAAGAIILQILNSAESTVLSQITVSDSQVKLELGTVGNYIEINNGVVDIHSMAQVQLNSPVVSIFNPTVNNRIKHVIGNGIVQTAADSMGYRQLVNGVCVVSCNNVGAIAYPSGGSLILVTAQELNGTPGALRVSSRTSNSFTVTSYDGSGAVQTADQAIFYWEIKNI